MWVSRYLPVCVEVKTDRGVSQLAADLEDIRINGADKYGFIIPDNCEICGKYNDFIPRELLKKQYVEDYLDIEDMQRNMGIADNFLQNGGKYYIIE